MARKKREEPTVDQHYVDAAQEDIGKRERTREGRQRIRDFIRWLRRKHAD